MFKLFSILLSDRTLHDRAISPTDWLLSHFDIQGTMYKMYR